MELGFHFKGEMGVEFINDASFIHVKRKAEEKWPMLQSKKTSYFLLI